MALRHAEELEAQAKSRRAKLKIVTTFSACAACFGIFVSVYFSGALSGNGGYIIIDEAPIPLAAFAPTGLPNESTLITVPVFGTLIVPVGETDTETGIINPNANAHYLVFQIVLKDTGQIVYTSEEIAPGMSTGNIRLSSLPPAGEHMAILTITPVGVDSQTSPGVINSTFLMVVK